MKRDRNKTKDSTLVQLGSDPRFDIPISQISLPNSEDLVAQLFEKEEFSRMEIKDMTANGGMSYLEIQHILATKTFLSDEDRKAFQESHHKAAHSEAPSTLSEHKSPFEELLNRLAGLIGSIFGFEGNKKDNNWLLANLFKR